MYFVSLVCVEPSDFNRCEGISVKHLWVNMIIPENAPHMEEIFAVQMEDYTYDGGLLQIFPKGGEWFVNYALFNN